jgi:chromosome partitioning protein
LKPKTEGNLMQPKILASEAADILGITVQAIYKQLKSKKLPHCKMRNRVYFEHNAAKLFFEAYKTPCKVAVFALVKGGVGKTTLCREVAIRSTLMGKKVLAIEIDHQWNLTKSFGVDPQNIPVLIDLLNNDKINITDSITPVIPGLDIIPSRYDNSVLDSYIMLKAIPLKKILKTRIEPLRKEYDLILIDCPPSLGQAVSAAVICSDLIILPTTPCDFSDSGIETTVREIKRMTKDYDINIPMKIVLNKYDNRESDSYETLSELIKHKKYGQILFNCYIRKCKEIEKLRRQHSTVFESTITTNGREDIDNFTRELLVMDRKKGEHKNPEAEIN